MHILNRVQKLKHIELNTYKKTYPNKDVATPKTKKTLAEKRSDQKKKETVEVKIDIIKY